MPVAALTVLIATALSAAAVDPRVVPVHHEPVVRDHSPVWELFDFLDTKVIQYQLVADEPVSRFTAKITFRLRDFSGKLVETDPLEGGCMYTHSTSTATLTSGTSLL